MAEEANTSSAGTNKACSNGRSRKNEYSDSKGTGAGVEVPPRRDHYAMEVDRGRNCYACGRFGHIAHYCRKRGRRVEFEGNYKYSNTLKGEENLESLD